MCLKLVVVIALISIYCTKTEGSTPIRKCTAELPEPYLVEINDCNVSPCILYAGATANLTIKFKAVNSTAENVQAEVVAYVNDDAFPFQMPHDYADVCKHLGNNVQCPLKAGDDVDYKLMLPLDHSLPDIFVEVEIAIVDEDNKNCLSCFVVDLRVKAQNHQHEHVKAE